jgi:tetratricopeptide (TPR) repeat protein
VSPHVIRSLPWFLLALLVTAHPDVALAQPKPGQAESNTESPEYKQAVDAALEEYRLQHFEEARSLFERAHAIDPNARTLRGLGMVEFERRHYVSAAELLGQALKSDRKPLTSEQRKSVEELLTRTQQFIARYNVQVEPDSSGLSVQLDGKPVELGTDRELSLDAGEHTLRISTPNAEPQELRIDVKGGEEQTLRIELQLKAAPAAAIQPPPSLPSAPKKQRNILGITLTSVGAGLAVSGGALGGIALMKAGDVKTQDEPDADKAHSLAIGADVLLGVGIASAVTGVVLLLVHRSKHADRTDARAHVEAAFPRLQVRF